MTNSSESILVLSMVAAGYHWRYKRELESQQRYATLNGYQYSCVFGPLLHRLGGEIVWYKMHLLRHALKRGYKWVLYLDADAAVMPDCPTIESVECKGKSIYMARGYSGRYNSGVMMFKNGPASSDFVERIIASRGDTLSADDSVGWGENGHVIAHAKHHPRVQELSSQWNNNYDPEMQDFIRHYSAGPLRALHKAPRSAKWSMGALGMFNRGLGFCLPALSLSAQAQWMDNCAASYFATRKQLSTECAPAPLC